MNIKRYEITIIAEVDTEEHDEDTIHDEVVNLIDELRYDKVDKDDGSTFSIQEL